MSHQKYYTMEVSVNGRYVFLPAERGRYIRTHWSAFYVDCPDKNCQAAAKTPCYNVEAYLAYDALVFQTKVHKGRINIYHKFQREERAVDTFGHKLKVRSGGRKRA